ncbi:MFS transporter, partial [Nonomuraea sp. NPDC002799]
RTEDLLATGQSQAAALTGGYHIAFTIAAALLVAAFAVALIVLRQPRPATQDTTPLSQAA